MIPARIQGATRYLGAPAGWEPATDGHCAHLAIRDVEINGMAPAMYSAWEPTPDELAALNAGAKILLIVVGRAHPPVCLEVGERPDPLQLHEITR